MREIGRETLEPGILVKEPDGRIWGWGNEKIIYENSFGMQYVRLKFETHKVVYQTIETDSNPTPTVGE